MGTKVIILLGLFLAVALLISSEVASARELAETTDAVDPSNEAAVTDQGGMPGGYGGGGNGGYGGGGNGTPGSTGGGSYCPYGCCGSYNGGCRCCTFAGQKPDVEGQN